MNDVIIEPSISLQGTGFGSHKRRIVINYSQTVSQCTHLDAYFFLTKDRWYDRQDLPFLDIWHIKSTECI